MSAEPSSQPESRPKLRLRTDKGSEGAPPKPTDSPDPAIPSATQDHPPAQPAAPAPPVQQALPKEPPAAAPAQVGSSAPVKLRPRISIKPSEPEPAGETISLPDFPPVGSAASPVTIGAAGMAGEKVKVDLKPIAKAPEGGVPAAAIPPVRPAVGDSPTPQARPPPQPAPPVQPVLPKEPPVQPVLPKEPPAAAPAQVGSSAPVKLRPRISIKPSEPEPAGETISLPDFPPVGSAASPVTIGAAGMAGEKVKVDIKPIAKPPEGGLPAAAIPPVRLTGGERAETGIKGKFKPASSGESPAPPIAPNPAEVKPAELPSLRPAGPSAPFPGLSPGKSMRVLVPAPGTRSPISAHAKPWRRALLPAFVGVLVICAGTVLWFVFRKAPAAPAASAPLAHPVMRVEKTKRREAASPVATNAAAQANVAVVAASLPAPESSPAAAAPGSISPPAAMLTNPPPAPQAVPPPPVPSLRFRAFVDRLKIGGIRVGPPLRLFVDGVTLRQGDFIDGDLGVVFVGIDPATSELIFKDQTGAEVRRHF